MLSRSIRSLGFGPNRMTSMTWCTRKLARKTALLNDYVNHKTMSTSTSTTTEDSKNANDDPGSGIPSASHVSKGGFAKAIAKMEGHESFPKTIKNSPLIKMGDPQGKIVEGTVIHVVDDDLYIDFGAKFNCVCPRPQKNGSAYTLGRKVRLMVHDLELSTRFLGAKSDLTILEADCSLLGLARLDK